MSLFGFASAAPEKKCIICEHIGFAKTEFAAHLNLLGIRKNADSTPGGDLQDLYLKDLTTTEMTQQNNYCLTAMVPLAADGQNSEEVYKDAGGTVYNHSPPRHIQTIGSGTNGFSYCVAQFFVYYAQDIDK